MPGPNSQVADLIMQLMMRGKSGGLPMQASPELTQYLAHAQGGTTPPQMRGMPSADVLPGPGSGAGAVREPFDFESAPTSMLQPNDPSVSEFTQNQAQQLSAMDLMSDRPPVDAFRHAGGDGTEDQLFIWAMKDGKRIKLDGPFTDDFTAARELKAMRDAGLDLEVEIGPDFDNGFSVGSTSLDDLQPLDMLTDMKRNYETTQNSLGLLRANGTKIAQQLGLRQGMSNEEIQQIVDNLDELTVARLNKNYLTGVDMPPKDPQNDPTTSREDLFSALQEIVWDMEPPLR